jgi:glucose 1-dehydrogenase
MLNLENKVALITGSDSGMGQAMAAEFASAGADIAVTFHSDRASAEETRRRVEEMGRRAIVRQLEVTDEASVAGLFDGVTGELGVPAILVNNALVVAAQASPRCRPRSLIVSSRRISTVHSSAVASSSDTAKRAAAVARSST